MKIRNAILAISLAIAVGSIAAPKAYAETGFSEINGHPDSKAVAKKKTNIGKKPADARIDHPLIGTGQATSKNQK